MLFTYWVGLIMKPALSHGGEYRLHGTKQTEILNILKAANTEGEIEVRDCHLEKQVNSMRPLGLTHTLTHAHFASRVTL